MNGLTEKQRQALELLTCGEGLTYKEIAERVGVTPKTIWSWRKESTEFQEELQKINDERWMATVDVARKGAVSLCKNGNQRMIEFVLKNEGYNPTQKIEGDIKNSITINIGEDETGPQEEAEEENE